MTENELEDTFLACFKDNKESLDLDYLNKFMTRATNGMFKKHGDSEVRAVFVEGKENQDVHNDLRWILEVGSLMTIFQFKLESSDLKIMQRQLIAILYEMNRLFANELVAKKVLPSHTNILFSYSDLASILQGSQQVFLKFCYDQSSQKLKEDAKTNLFANYFDVMVHLLI